MPSVRIALALERVGRDLAKVRIFRLEARHAAHANAGSDGLRCFIASARTAGENGVDSRACRSMCTSVISQVMPLAIVCSRLSILDTVAYQNVSGVAMRLRIQNRC